jgi:diguanylate cyclase (GGDEF)-like protein/PAS domain S-box-containing protein
MIAFHVFSDAILCLSLITIAITVGVMRMRYQRDIPFGWIAGASGVLLLGAGGTYLMDVLLLWSPTSWLSGSIRLFTMLTSIVTAIALPFLVPKIGVLLRDLRLSRLNEERFLVASNNSHEAFYILESERDSQGEIVDFRFVFVNENGAKLVSHTRDELQGKLLCDVLPINRTGGFLEAYKRVVETGEPISEEFPVDVANVKATWLRHQVVKLHDGLAISTTNVSDRKQAELKVIKSLAFTRSLVESSPFAVIAVGLDGLISEMNPAAERMVGYSREELVGKSSPHIFHDPEEVARRAEELSRELGETIEPETVFTARPKRGLTEESEWSFVRRDGSRLLVQLTVTAVTDTEQNVTAWLGVAYDITERKRMEEYITHIAHHDALTGLATRTLLHDRVEKALDRARRNSTKIGLLMIDLDNFKRVNDLMGHGVGDDLLISVAKRLEGAIRKADTVARMGGDEFIVLLDDLRSSEDAEMVAAKLVEVLSAPVMISGEEHTMSASLGLCLYPEGGQDSSALLKNADAAMYFAKAQGRNMYQVFSEDMATTTAKRRRIENALYHALARNEFELVYQPQVEIGSGQVTGVEALLRWRSKSLGLVMPVDFIPVAEETGLIVPIGEWVLRTACAEAKALETRLGRPVIMGVNFSPRQFQQEGLPRIVEDALTSSGLSPKSLELEITENILVSDSAKAMRVLDRIRALGVRLAIDDFGTGFSSMSYILKFNVDRLKIDQSFIRNMISDPNSFAVTRAIIALARGLNINVVAEGVETEEILELLKREGCDEAQGYFYSKPVPMSAIDEAVASMERKSLAARVRSNSAA